MANSKITISFLKDALATEYISFKYRLSGSLDDGVEVKETWQDGPRLANGTIQTTTTPVFLLPLYISTINRYFTYVNIDYNNFNIFNLDINAGDVVITLNNPNYEIYDFQQYFIDDQLVEVSIINNVVNNFVLLQAERVLQADSDFCLNFKISFLTNLPADTININGLIVNNIDEDNPYESDLLRGVEYRFILSRTVSNLTNTINYPTQPDRVIYIPVLTEALFTVNVLNTLNGATVSFLYNQPLQSNPPLTFEYSLNEIDWQFENNFTGQAEGDYTVYIRDNLGCQISIDYVVDEYGTRAPYHFISKANSLNFIEQQDADNCSIYKNDNNTFSACGLNKISYYGETLLQKCDNKITTQLKSNYRNVSAVLRKEDGTEEDLVVTKMSENLNRFLSLDAIMYSYSIGYSAVYFDSGNLYDEVGGVIGSFELLGNLPDLAILGGIINVEGLGNFEILDIVFDPNVNKKVLVFQYFSQPNLFFDKIVYSIYDLLPFEVYHFDIFPSLMDVGLYDIVVTNEDQTNGEVIYISENINIQIEHYRTVFIEYYNRNNKDIFYKYGIKNYLRVNYQNIYASIEDEIELSDNEQETIVVNSNFKDGNVFVFDELSRSFAIKLIIALSLEFVKIQGEWYAKKSSIKPTPIEGTNLYLIEADMIKTDSTINNIGGEENITIPGEPQLNIPPFVIGDNNFVTS